LGLSAAIAIVVGEVIGSGIFFKPREVAEFTGGFLGIILSLWVVCGLVNLCGALALAELSAMFPQSGGTYVFLRETYGKLWAFLWCWGEFWVMRTGAIAAMAVYSTYSLEQLAAAAGWQFSDSGWANFRQASAVGIIALLGAVNIAGTQWGGRVQMLMTAIKVAFVAFLGVLPFLAMGEAQSVNNDWWPHRAEPSLLAGIGAALGAIMWAFDGWGNVTVVAEEIHNPERNVPRALVGGVLLVIVLYFGANLAYHLTLPASQIATEMIPAQAVCEKLLPGFGGKLLVSMLLVSLMGTINGNILVGPRVLYAAARDHAVLTPFRRVQPRTQTPAVAIAAVACWSIALILLPDFRTDQTTPLADWLTTYCVFGGSIFYLSAVLAVFVQRMRNPNVPRPYRAWGYPVTPAIFVLFYLFLLTSMFVARPNECLWGLTLIATGLVLYLAMPKRWRDEARGTRREG
jgi:APA family basic amino acid/polyamine antiporter